jgi:hypothetical protein
MRGWDWWLVMRDGADTSGERDKILWIVGCDADGRNEHITRFLPIFLWHMCSSSIGFWNSQSLWSV